MVGSLVGQSALDRLNAPGLLSCGVDLGENAGNECPQRIPRGYQLVICVAGMAMLYAEHNWILLAQSAHTVAERFGSGTPGQWCPIANPGAIPALPAADFLGSFIPSNTLLTQLRYEACQIRS